MLQIDGYHLNEELRLDRKDTTNGIGGGLLVYSKNSINIKALNNTNDFNQFCQFEVASNDNNYPHCIPSCKWMIIAIKRVHRFSQLGIR